ncbi:hypothetical protein M422DRAFT_128736, partial [Sphaerobolus stellatus SS14]
YEKSLASFRMPFHHISKDIKQRSLWLLANGYTVQEICHVLNVSDRSIRRWSRLYDELGDVVPLPNPNQGRPRFLKPLQVHSLAEKIQECPEMYLDELRDWLAL